jgi:hypothetical protein
MKERIYSFVGGETGRWQVTQMTTLMGEPLPLAACLDVREDHVLYLPAGGSWILRGRTSSDRYTTTAEREPQTAVQPPLNRKHATCGALISVKRSESWRTLTQEESRSLQDETSRITMRYVPAIASRTYYGYELGENFDVLMWFEFAPDDADTFDYVLYQLRETTEWRYVEREIEIRLTRPSTN